MTRCGPPIRASSALACPRDGASTGHPCFSPRRAVRVWMPGAARGMMRGTTTMTKAAGIMRKTTSGAEESGSGLSPSQAIDAKIEALNDWRGAMLARVRALIREAVPEAVETVKWRGVPVWEHAGIICTGETYKSVVKLTFAKGAALEDPSGLFNASLEGNTRRAIDLREGDVLDEKAFKALIRAAAALNESSAAKRPKRRAPLTSS